MKILFKSILTIAFLLAITSFISPNLGENENKNTTDNSPKATCKFQLIGIKCIQTEGWNTPDAIYLKLKAEGNSMTWPDNRMRFSPGDYENLTSLEPIEMRSELVVEMWDDDTFDADDFLGRGTISCAHQGAGEKFILFNKDGANYKLYFKVF